MKFSQIINKFRNIRIVQLFKILKIVLFGVKKNSTKTKIKNYYRIKLIGYNKLNQNEFIVAHNLFGGHGYQLYCIGSNCEGEHLEYYDKNWNKRYKTKVDKLFVNWMDIDKLIR